MPLWNLNIRIVAYISDVITSTHYMYTPIINGNLMSQPPTTIMMTTMNRMMMMLTTKTKKKVMMMMMTITTKMMTVSAKIPFECASSKEYGHQIWAQYLV